MASEVKGAKNGSSNISASVALKRQDQTLPKGWPQINSLLLRVGLDLG